jgi:hypothetical protein
MLVQSVDTNIPGSKANDMTHTPLYWFLCLLITLILLTACQSNTPQTMPSPSVAATDPATTPSQAGERDEPAEDADDSATSITTPTLTLPTPQTIEPEATGIPSTLLLPEEPAPRGAESEFTTDFSKHSVPYDEILSGGVPKDGIPAIDDPTFVSVEAADDWIEDVEPVIQVQTANAVKAYPLQILTWHEIVNDTVGDTPLSITFCPLCNTAIVFERSLPEQEAVLDFGTSGRLRFSNLIMYDRQTETWWQQATGEAIAGELTGSQLAFHPAQIVSWEDFKVHHAEGQVLSRDTGYGRSYGQNPYAGYDSINQSPFLYEGPETPDTLPPMARVLAVESGDETVAYPFAELQQEQVVNDTVGTTAIVLFWQAGTASALDDQVLAAGRDVGTANAYRRTVDGQELTFRSADGQFVDEQTESVWNAQGEALRGELAGTRLEPVVAINHFWFSWAAFKPETRVYRDS